MIDLFWHGWLVGALTGGAAMGWRMARAERLRTREFGARLAAMSSGFEGAAGERRRLAKLLASAPASEEIADFACILGLTEELDAAWDELHPDDKGKPRGWQQKGLEK